MDWVIRTFGTSVGKKLLMAVTGMSFCAFLLVHLAGNLTIYGGRTAFNGYAARLHALGGLLTVAEFGLLFLALVHVVTGVLLVLQNYLARPERYAHNARGGGRTIGSATMPYTGVLILLFVVFHLSNFSFVDKSRTTIFDIVSSAFSSPLYVAVYVVAMLAVALHVSHGFWSLFQTLGANHPKYMPAVMAGSVVFALVVAAGFGFIPIYLAMS